MTTPICIRGPGLTLELEAYRSRAPGKPSTSSSSFGPCCSRARVLPDLPGRRPAASLMAVCRERCVPSAPRCCSKTTSSTRGSFVRPTTSPTGTRRSTASKKSVRLRDPEDHGLFWQVLKQGDVMGVRQMDGGPRSPPRGESGAVGDAGRRRVPLMRAGKVIGIPTLGPTADGRASPRATTTSSRKSPTWRRPSASPSSSSAPTRSSKTCACSTTSTSSGQRQRLQDPHRADARDGGRGDEGAARQPDAAQRRDGQARHQGGR